MSDTGDFRAHQIRLDHTAHAVRSIAEASKLYRDVLGGSPRLALSLEREGFRFEQLHYPGGKIELLEPIGGDGFLARFLRERGEGLHHLTFRVARLEELVRKLSARGYRIVGERYGDPAWKEAFIAPRHAHGTVLQLAESNRPTDGDES